MNHFTDKVHAEIKAAVGSNQAEWSTFDHNLLNLAREADAEIERLNAQVVDLTVQLRDARNQAWSTERETRRHTLRTTALRAEADALHAALDAALFSLCTDDYESQQAVAAELKLLNQQTTQEK